MAKAKAKDTTSADAPDQSQTIHIERGPWDIDTSTIRDIIDQGDGEFMLLTTAGSFRLTEDEVQPFLEFKKE